MRQVVAIPAANRPELLALSLEKLKSARSSVDVHIYADSVPEARLREIEVVRDLYFPEAFLFHAGAHQKAPSGCWNILNSIKHAAQFADDVYLVEEDVLVYPNFFEWHRSQTAVASCGRQNYPHWEHRHLYTNPGSLLRRPLLDALTPHINEEYFRDTTAYCVKHFPPWEVASLDDWLIRRVMKEHGWDAAYGAPVCAHIGFRAYNRLHIYSNRDGGVLERVARAREIMAAVKKTDRYATDWEPYEPYFAKT
jgi:hypothetical protein